MIRAIAIALALALLPAPAGAQESGDGTAGQTRFIIIDRLVWREDAGIFALPSRFTFEQTVDRLRTMIGSKGFTIYAEIDHEAEAEKAGRTMPPMRLLLIGAPTAATPMLPEAPTLGLDLPYAILVWREPTGRTIIAYDDPAWLARRHGIRETDDQIRRIGNIVADIARTAGGAP
jgi:uncharacterized protein (DUF302 family)